MPEIAAQSLINLPEVRGDFVPCEDYVPPVAMLERERLWPRVWQGCDGSSQ